MTLRALTGACLLFIGAASCQRSRAHSASFNDKGAAEFPENFRQWVHVGARIKVGGISILDGSRLTAPQFLNSYVEPAALAAYKRTGKWPDGSEMVKELTEAETAGDCDERTFLCTNRLGTGFFEARHLGVGMMIKDRNRFPYDPGNWGYFALLYTRSGFESTATELAPERCATCHVKLASDTDYVISGAHLDLSAIAVQ